MACCPSYYRSKADHGVIFTAFCHFLCDKRNLECSRMIEIAGGRYIFENLKNEENNLSSVSLTMEEFYNQAIDADYLIYNATIDSPVETVDELLAKSELLADFKAVKEGNVWCTDKYMYQATDIIGNMITDIHLMLTEGDDSQMTFMKKIS